MKIERWFINFLIYFQAYSQRITNFLRHHDIPGYQTKEEMEKYLYTKVSVGKRVGLAAKTLREMGFDITQIPNPSFGPDDERIKFVQARYDDHTRPMGLAYRTWLITLIHNPDGEHTLKEIQVTTYLSGPVA